MKRVSIIIFVLIIVVAVVGYTGKIGTGANTFPGATSVYDDLAPGSIIGTSVIQSKEPVSRALVVLISGFLIVSLLASIRRKKKRRVIKKSKPSVPQFNSQIKHPS
jgi:hypothetical protein